MTCFRRERSSAASRRSGRAVVQVAEGPGDALLQPLRVAPAHSRSQVVVALEHQRVAARQHLLDVRGGSAEVGEHAQAPRAVAEHELHRLARVVRHGEGLDADRAHREAARAPRSCAARRPRRAPRLLLRAPRAVREVHRDAVQRPRTRRRRRRGRRARASPGCRRGRRARGRAAPRRRAVSRGASPQSISTAAAAGLGHQAIALAAAAERGEAQTTSVARAAA